MRGGVPQLKLGDDVRRGKNDVLVVYHNDAGFGMLSPEIAGAPPAYPDRQVNVDIGGTPPEVVAVHAMSLLG